MYKALEINRTWTYKKEKKLANLIEDIRIMNIVIDEIDKNHFLSAYSAKRWSVYFKEKYYEPFTINHKKLERIFKRFNHIAYYIKNQSKHYLKKQNAAVRKNYLKEAKELGYANIWTTDITEFNIKNQKGYICTILNHETGEILGKSKSIGNQKTPFVLEALNMAYENKKSLGAILLHSDNGSQYTSDDYIELCNQLNITRSYSTPGTPYHNGKHESFHGRLKDETLRTHNIRNIFECIDITWKWLIFYMNNKRLCPNKLISDFVPFIINKWRTFMKGIILNTMKQEQLRLIKELSLGNDSLKNIAYKLGYSIRHTRRKLKEYREIGAKAFIHKNTNKKPVNKLDQFIKDQILEQFEKKYFDFSIYHYWELVWKEKISYSSIRKILIDNNLLIETLHRKTKKDIRKNLKATKPEEFINEHLNSIIANKPHPTQKKIVKFGEIWEADASNHQWIKGLKTHLHIVIDKASKRILSGYFSEQETTESYFNIYKQAFKTYGLPELNVTDNRNVFSSKNNRDHVGTSISNTQLQFIFHSLGVRTKTTSIPQEKALVERTFGTLQRRWPQIIRLLGLNNIDQLNENLPQLIEEYNNDFSIPLEQLESVTRTFDKDENIIFSYRSERVVNSGHSISYDNKKWFICEGFTPLYLKPKLKVMIMKTSNNKLYASIGNDIYNILEVEDERLHGTLHSLPKEEFEKIKLPKIDSPWRHSHWYLFNKKRKNTRAYN